MVFTCGGFSSFNSKHRVVAQLPDGANRVTMQITSALILGALLLLPLPQKTAPFKIKVAEVQIAATVRDNNSRLVADRNKEDFLLKEDGKPQEIEYFARQLDLAPTLGLLVDSSMSQRQVLQEERKASLEFFQQVLRPEKDLAFVIGFDFEAKLMEPDKRSGTPRQVPARNCSPEKFSGKASRSISSGLPADRFLGQQPIPRASSIHQTKSAYPMSSGQFNFNP